MSPDTEPPPKIDPDTWVMRFDKIMELVRKNAEIAQSAAQTAAIKVTAENTRSQQKIRKELLARQDEDRKRADALHAKVDALHDQMNDVLACLTKLSTTKLIQTAFTSLVLAAMVVVMIKVLGG